ncbi:MAG: mechanosensitive ion channel family protein [Bryobacteraceae bacterium]|nr:mechanosensitive ion channel family protein [Bryobacteraceae bacterium]
MLDSLFRKTLWFWVHTLGWFFGSLAALLLLRWFLLRLIRRRETDFARVAFDTLRWPSFFWSLAGALHIGLRFAELTDRQDKLLSTWVIGFLIVSLTLVAANVLVRLLVVYGSLRNMEFAISGLSRAMLHVFVYSFGLLVLLGYLGISITPALTALGVGGLAVALALQETLGNFFAGVLILVESPIRVGDFITLSSGEEGTVTDIGWRTTRVVMGTNNSIVIPNSKITSSILINYSLPAHMMVTPVDIFVAPTADLDVVTRLAQEAAAEAIEAGEGVLAEPAPAVMFDPGPLPTHFQLKLLVAVADRLQVTPVRSAVRLRLMKKFQAHDVPLPLGERLIGWP